MANMDYEYDDEPLEGRILWGRMAVYGVALVLVFALGSCVGSRGGASEEELEQLSEQVRLLASENADLEQQLAAAGAGGSQPAPATDGSAEPGDPDPDGDGDGDGGDEPAGSGDEPPADGGGDTQVYTVRSGDSLYRIATQFYGDGSKWRLIADANGLDGDNRLTVGQELRIPPEG